MLLSRGARSGLAVLAICLIAGGLGFGLKGEAGVRQITLYLILGLFAMSVDVMWGYSGLLSFGQAAFFGLGAFAYTWIRMGVPAEAFWYGNASLIGLTAALVLPALLAVIVGYFLFYGRISGPNFTVVTLALSFLVSLMAMGWSSVFGGYTGIPHVPPLSVSLGGLVLSARGGLASFAAVVTLCVLVTVCLRAVLETPFGLVLDGLRDSEQRLEYLGVNVARTKLVVWTISAAVAGIAGGVYASITGYVGYDLLGVLMSTEAVIWVAVGGRGLLVGAFLGALVVRAMSFFLSGIALSYWMLFLGVLFVAIVLFGSNGIMGLLKQVRRGVSRATGS